MKRFSSLLLRFVVDWRAQLLDKNLTFERKMLSTRRLFSNLFKMHFNSIEPFDIFLCQTQTSFSRGFGGPILFRNIGRVDIKNFQFFINSFFENPCLTLKNIFRAKRATFDFIFQMKNCWNIFGAKIQILNETFAKIFKWHFSWFFGVDCQNHKRHLSFFWHIIHNP